MYKPKLHLWLSNLGQQSQIFVNLGDCNWSKSAIKNDVKKIKSEQTIPILTGLNLSVCLSALAGGRLSAKFPFL
jgi:hypothetical protein